MGWKAGFGLGSGKCGSYPCRGCVARRREPGKGSGGRGEEGEQGKAGIAHPPEGWGLWAVLLRLCKEKKAAKPLAQGLKGDLGWEGP